MKEMNREKYETEPLNNNTINTCYSCSEYEKIVGSNVMDELLMIAGNLKGKVIQNINSTAVGGRRRRNSESYGPYVKGIGGRRALGSY